MEAAATSDATEGPILSLINKRLRALRKKQNRITQMEEAVSQGKPINKEQEETLKSKPSVLAAIDELEKLRQPLSAAVADETQLALERHTPTQNPPTPETLEKQADDDSGLEAAAWKQVLTRNTDARDPLVALQILPETTLMNHNSLATADNLLKRNISSNPICKLREQEEDNMAHPFFKSYLSNHIWFASELAKGPNDLNLDPMSKWLTYWINQNNLKWEQKQQVLILSAAVCWAIWKAIIEAVFEGTYPIR
ncbi:hypothetical protein RJ640_005234 [Escallonia rubra]|uniref:Reverse transcriptase zinc-binding domain-containing protein n=1 Tax=Escallonia rubra TaxID=112253 RepID=A0AA88U949_9ASTE|nr:hypothetical protein RJ640_005234 [Escallonia rubra]